MAEKLGAAAVLAKARPGDALAWPPEHRSKAVVVGQDFYSSGGHGDPAQQNRQQRTGLFLEDNYGNSYTVRFSDTAPEGGGHVEGSAHMPSGQVRPGTRYVAISSGSAHGTYPLFKKRVEYHPAEARVNRPLEGAHEHYEYTKDRRSRAPDPGLTW
jgi:hypothetical protein